MPGLTTRNCWKWWSLRSASPQTPIILNHLGGVIGIGPYADKRDATLAEWHTSLRELARCDNVFV